MLVFAATNNEYTKFQEDRLEGKPISSAAITFLLLGCVVGTGIGYSGWWCRGKVSATSFTLIGVINKCLTILLNLLIWDQHAKPAGIASLLLCLVGGAVYKQAPMREELATGEDVVKNADDVWEVEMGKDAKSSEEVNLLVPDESSGAGDAVKRRTAA